MKEIQLYTKSNATSLWIRKLVDYTGGAIQIEESSESIGNLIEVAVGWILVTKFFSWPKLL